MQWGAATLQAAFSLYEKGLPLKRPKESPLFRNHTKVFTTKPNSRENTLARRGWMFCCMAKNKMVAWTQLIRPDNYIQNLSTCTSALEPWKLPWTSTAEKSTNKGINYARNTQHNVPLREFMYLAFTRMPGESYRRRLRSLLSYLCHVIRALINSLVSWFCTSAVGLVLFQICCKMSMMSFRILSLLT